MNQLVSAAGKCAAVSAPVASTTIHASSTCQTAHWNLVKSSSPHVRAMPQRSTTQIPNITPALTLTLVLGSCLSMKTVALSTQSESSRASTRPVHRASHCQITSTSIPRRATSVLMTPAPTPKTASVLCAPQENTNQSSSTKSNGPPKPKLAIC